MLESITFTGRELLLALVLATLVYLVEAWIFSRRGKKSSAQDQSALIGELQDEVKHLIARVDLLEARPPTNSTLDTQSTTHAEAVRMAREGLTGREIASQLGISHTEADLIIALHKAE